MIKDLFLSLAAKLKGSPKVVGEIMYGLMLHEMDLEMKKERGHLDNLFMLVIFGDLIGLPLLHLIIPCDSCLISFLLLKHGKEEC